MHFVQKFLHGIGWIPLGGYVKISGMIDESMDTVIDNVPLVAIQY